MRCMEREFVIPMLELRQLSLKCQCSSAITLSLGGNDLKSLGCPTCPRKFGNAVLSSINQLRCAFDAMEAVRSEWEIEFHVREGIKGGNGEKSLPSQPPKAA